MSIEGFKSAANLMKGVLNSTKVGQAVWTIISEKPSSKELNANIDSAQLSGGKEAGIKALICLKAFFGTVATIVATPLMLITVPIALGRMAYVYTHEDEKSHDDVEKSAKNAFLFGAAPMTTFAATLKSIYKDIERLEAFNEARENLGYLY